MNPRKIHDLAPRALIVAMVTVGLLLPGTPLDAQGTDPWFGRDKALHFSLGAAFAAGGYAGTARLTKDRKPRILVGLSIGVGANGAKEVRDRRTGGDPSWKDFTMGALGSALGTTAAWLIDRR